MSCCPVCPHPALNFKLEIELLSFKKLSFETTHANAAPGKMAVWFDGSNLLEVSLLKFSVNKYLLSKPTLARPK